MPMEEHKDAPCPKCSKPLTWVDGVYECHHCFEVNEVWNKQEIWTHIKSPVGLIKVTK